jgi:hypothetical protein
MADIRSDRKIRIDLAAPFDGWFAEMKLHVPFKLALLLESENAEDRVNAIRSLIVTHNFREEVGYEEILADPTDAPDDAIDQLLTKWAAVKGAVPSA